MISYSYVPKIVNYSSELFYSAYKGTCSIQESTEVLFHCFNCQKYIDNVHFKHLITNVRFVCGLILNELYRLLNLCYFII